MLSASNAARARGGGCPSRPPKLSERPRSPPAASRRRALPSSDASCRACRSGPPERARAHDHRHGPRSSSPGRVHPVAGRPPLHPPRRSGPRPPLGRGLAAPDERVCAPDPAPPAARKAPERTSEDRERQAGQAPSPFLAIASEFRQTRPTAVRASTRRSSRDLPVVPMPSDAVLPWFLRAPLMRTPWFLRARLLQAP